MKNRTRVVLYSILMLTTLLLVSCDEPVEIPDRESVIPDDMVDMSPANDTLPPILHSDEFEQPIPLPYPVNTRGAEDSAFILPDGNTLFVWFTPNNRMDVYEQAVDLVTGIYKFEKTSNGWSDAERIWLVKPGKPHLDGCGFFLDDKAWICGVREGVEGIQWFTSEFSDGQWSNAELAVFNPEYEVGELHISQDGTQLYFHSRRAGGRGGLDIWMSEISDGVWGEPVNLVNVNSEYDDGWPALNPQENELWITKNYGIWRSQLVDGVWQTPVEIVGSLAGEATIDRDGNVYFTHHYFEGDYMIEADIYVIYRKQ